ncbi:MAG: hypothetical protein OXJ37_16425 [Bryobacterales bacterium]|nr:hypothetical protein [Bryobacterales bacterium]MDE0263990.1 hypothetical protein [Bryobacterales bacterium]
MRTGLSHARCYRVDREVLGGNLYDAAAYGEDSYPQEGALKGRFSQELFDERDMPRIEENVLPPATIPAVRECGDD